VLVSIEATTIPVGSNQSKSLKLHQYHPPLQDEAFHLAIPTQFLFVSMTEKFQLDSKKVLILGIKRLEG